MPPRTKLDPNGSTAEAKGKTASKARSPAKAAAKPAKGKKAAGKAQPPHKTKATTQHIPTVTGVTDGTAAGDELQEVIRRYHGRPTKYDPAFCDAVVAWGTLGKSKAWMCAELMIARPTMDRWIQDQEDFSYAMGVALRLSQQWWEDKGQQSLSTIGFQGAMYSRSMAARFPEDWRESKELVGANGAALIPVLNVMHTDGRSGG